MRIKCVLKSREGYRLSLHQTMFLVTSSLPTQTAKDLGTGRSATTCQWEYAHCLRRAWTCIFPPPDGPRLTSTSPGRQG